MLPLGLIGLLFSMEGYFLLGGPRNVLMPFFYIFISVWSSLFCHAWDKREKEIAFCFDALDYELVEE